MRRLAVVLLAMAGVLGSPGAVGATRFDEYSVNWAGYYVNRPANQFVTQVSATVVAPSPRALPPFESGSWVGVGGSYTKDLIQAGVAYGPRGFYAWYELLPENVRTIRNCAGDDACSVRPGDRVDVDIRYLGGESWQIYLTNLGKWAWFKVVQYMSTFSSAEWIYEAPSQRYAVLNLPGLPSSHAAAVFLRPRYALNGFEQPLQPSNAVRSHVSPVGIVNIATTSALGPSANFAVCPYRQACQAP